MSLGSYERHEKTKKVGRLLIKYKSKENRVEKEMALQSLQ